MIKHYDELEDTQVVWTEKKTVAKHEKIKY